MSSKRSAPPTPGSSEKKRKVLSLAEKMDVLAVIDSGLGWSATGKKFGLHEATVRTIWKTREKIRQSVRESADASSKVASVSRRDPLLEKMEKILNRWISEQVDQRKSNVDGIAIREKARSIYDHLAEKEPSGSSPAPGFIASHGWFHRFKQRFSLHNIARTGDDADEDDDTETRPVFTIMKLRNLLREADNLTELFTDQDPIQERSIKFKRVVDEGLIPYKETLRSMEASACQKPITAFFKPSPASTPAKKHSTPATPPVTTPARQPVTPATPDNTTSSMSSVSPIPLCGFDDPDDTDSE
ncbi:Tigger transposable element-derived protein 1 [Chionoecetes opilio]|uniref:Tigger transposable element-derived protein 1 n=1 Tax=Chionoecetes opilio TaxID=41210 RepID=A0A8J4XQU1_CHIOP|nr:Tigger transposable element-derived protein 1 [Chionoecetes opilio]